MFIYLIVDHETGKYYVGQHKGNNLKKYLQQKFHHAQRGISNQSRLYQSMRAHSDPSSWSIHALPADITDREELDQTERDFIKFLRSQDPEYGYNICRGGEGRTGPLSDETRKKIGEGNKAAWANPETKQSRIDSIRKCMCNREVSQETRQKLSNALTGREVPIEERIKMSKVAKGRKQAPECTAKISASNRGRKRSEEFRAKCRQRVVSDETRAKLSKIASARRLSPEIRAKISKSTQGRQRDKLGRLR